MHRNAAILLAVFGLSLSGILGAQNASSTALDRSVAPSPAFIENHGVWGSNARFVFRRGDFVARIGERAVTLQLLTKRTRDEIHGHVVKLAFEGANTASTLVGHQLRSGTETWLLGGEAQVARRFARLKSQDLYPGVDLVWRLKDGHLEYDIEVDKGVSLDRVSVLVRGASSIDVDARGALRIRLGDKSLVQPAPTTWEIDERGQRVPVLCRYRLLGENRYGFEAPGRTRDRRLVVDPTLSWSTFVGAADYDYVRTVATDASGNAFIAGASSSRGLPTTAGAFRAILTGLKDGFVGKVSADGRRFLYLTYFGGELDDEVFDVAVDASGNATVTGHTYSRTFPTTRSAFLPRFVGGGDTFVSRLNASGTGLVWSTYLGGRDYEIPSAVALAGDGSAVVVGWTRSADYPTTRRAYDTTYAGGGDGFVTRVTADGRSLLFSSFLGNRQWDDPRDVVVDANNITVVGEAWGVGGPSDFPTTSGAFQTRYGGGSSDVFVARLDLSGQRLLFSTFVGGSGWDPVRGAVLSGNDVLIVGQTSSSNWPTTSGAYDRSYGGGADGFVTRVSGRGDRVLASTFLGTSDPDRIVGAGVDSLGRVVVGGTTFSASFPTTSNAFQRTFAGGSSDAFVARLSGDLKSLSDSTFYGGASYDEARAAALGPSGSMVIAGEAWSSNFPTSATAADRTYAGGGDGFVGRVDFGSVTKQYRLDIASTEPSSGVQIAVSPRDASGNGNGTTPFGRVYTENTTVTLTAPSATTRGPFRRWVVDSVAQPNGQRIVSFRMTANRRAVAEYAVTRYRLDIASTEPSSGVGISVSPLDTSGNGNGTTPFARTYLKDTTVTLTAPSATARGPFVRWVVDSVGQPNGQRVVSIRMTANRRAVAEYSVTRYRLDVASTEPSSGVAITVTPRDASGNGNGATPFARSYVKDTDVTLTAPTSSTRGPFKRWFVDTVAQPLGQRTVRVKMSAARSARAEFYVYSRGSFTAFGRGCPGTGAKIPVHSGGGQPDIGQPIQWRISNARAASPVALFLGSTRVSVDLTQAGMPGCFAYVPAIATLVFVTDAAGAGFAPIPIPNDKGLIGAGVVTQCTVFDIGASTAVKFVWTNGLETKVGGSQ